MQKLMILLAATFTLNGFAASEICDISIDRAVVTAQIVAYTEHSISLKKIAVPNLTGANKASIQAEIDHLESTLKTHQENAAKSLADAKKDCQ